MSFLLDLKHLAVFERPLDDIRLVRRALDVLAFLDLGPELAEVLQLDQVPHVAELGLDDGRLADGGGGGDAHDDGLCGGVIGGGDWSWRRAIGLV
jgi:hypothetical protein